jgi:ribosomal protein L44E
MSSNVFCPDCNSHDIQEIVKEKLTIKPRGSMTSFLHIFLYVILALLAVGFIGNDMPVPGVIIILGLVSFYFFNKKREIKTETAMNCHYVCRSCGREFQSDTN